MQFVRNALLAGVAAVGFGLFGTASAQPLNTMTVRLPGGGVAAIQYTSQYTGNVPPQVTFLPAETPVSPWLPVASWFGPDSPFAMSPFATMERISAAMDREAAAMFRQAEALARRARSGQPTEVTWGNMPPGSQSYSYISTISGSGVCTQSVQITATANGPPRVERHSTGNCGAGAPADRGGADAVRVPAPAAPGKQPDLILTRNGGPPFAGMIRSAAAVR
jgi:hypothetical protein